MWRQAWPRVRFGGAGALYVQRPGEHIQGAQGVCGGKGARCSRLTWSSGAGAPCGCLTRAGACVVVAKPSRAHPFRTSHRSLTVRQACTLVSTSHFGRVTMQRGTGGLRGMRMQRRRRTTLRAAPWRPYRAATPWRCTGGGPDTTSRETWCWGCHGHAQVWDRSRGRGSPFTSTVTHTHAVRTLVSVHPGSVPSTCARVTAPWADTSSF
jgi:hypothetical protein